MSELKRSTISDSVELIGSSHPSRGDSARYLKALFLGFFMVWPSVYLPTKVQTKEVEDRSKIFLRRCRVGFGGYIRQVN